MEITYSIRRATTEDAAGILDCLQLAFAPFRGRYTPAAYEDTVLTSETVRRRIAVMQVYVAITDTNRVVGTIACNVVDRVEGHLRGMAVVPKCQGFGVANALLKTAEAALVENGCSLITLDTTMPLERAIRFYERNSFRSTGKVTDFFGLPLYQYAKTITRWNL